MSRPDVLLVIGPGESDRSDLVSRLQAKNPHLNIVVVEYVPTGCMLPTLAMKDVVKSLQMHAVKDEPISVKEYKDNDRSQWKYRQKHQR